jgi:serine/threonine-protein kinase
MSFIPGANIGPYRIVEQAERNGVATTYTAYQPSLGRYVNLVVVPAIDRDDVSLQRQYQRQLDLVLTLRHPNILTVIDNGEHLDVPFVVTEMIEAEPLSDRLGAPWPLAEVTRVLRPIAAALDYAHGLGVVHGDVRSSSVLLTPDGTPILAGFGLMTRPLAVPAGTAAELGRRAPSLLEEIAQAQPADRRGLALIAYEMLTGRTTDVDTTDFGRPLLPAQIGSPLLAAPVERVLLRELTGEAPDRYPTATEFVDDLSTPVEATRTNGATLTPPTAPPPPTATTPQPASSNAAGQDSRRRLMTVALIFAALALLGALAILLRGGDAARPIASPGRTPGAEAATPATGAPAAGAPSSSGASSSAPAASAPSSGGPTSAASASRAAATGATAAGVSAGAPGAGAAGASAPSGGAAASGAPARGAAGDPVATPGAATGAAPQPKAPSAASASGQAPGPAPTPIAVLTPRPAPTISLIVPTLPPTLDTSTGAAPSGASAIGAPAAAAPPSGAPPTAAQTPRQATPAPAAAGTTRLPVTWRVVGDPSGRWMLDDQNRVAGRTETGASVVLFPEMVVDVNFSASLNTTSCQATLVFRAQDDENLLMAIYIPDGLPAPGTAGGGVWLYQRVEGMDLTIRAVRPSTVRPAGEPARLKIVTSGPNINIFLNDEPALQAVDTAPRSGRLGLMVYSANGRLCEATFGDIQR